MVTFRVLCCYNEPKLWIWRDGAGGGAAALAYYATPLGIDADGLAGFQALLDAELHAQVHAELHNEDWQRRESPTHIKTLPRTAHYRFPQRLWLVEGTSRVLTHNPFASKRVKVRIHLVTSSRYQTGQLFAWLPGRGERRFAKSGTDHLGPYFDLALEGAEQSWFCFKFVDEQGQFESDRANRLYVANDGAEIWTHPESAAISLHRPSKRALVVHARLFSSQETPRLHLWQPESDVTLDVAGTLSGDGWARFEAWILSGICYRFLLAPANAGASYEHPEATRNVVIKENGTIWTTSGDDSERQVSRAEVWTLEGDRQLFESKPARSKTLTLEIAAREPAGGLATSGAVELDVWINRSLGLLEVGITQDRDGVYRVQTYPEVVTSFRFRAGSEREHLERHTVKLGSDELERMHRYVVLGRADSLVAAPPADLFRDPPFEIRRPGAWEEAGMLRFALHCPSAASAAVMGEFSDWEADAVPMRSTLDSAYWWAELPVATVLAKLGVSSIDGALYKFLLNQVLRVQDPAADWVENSDPGRASKLVDHALYRWQSSGWRRPSWDSLIVYQVHPACFSQRTGTTGLDGITREVTDAQGYIRQLGVSALLLMPICEFAGDHGWGYNPSFYYSVESAYGGPAALKRLVDACHEHGLAVLLDVVFNHAGTSDNVLWTVASESYFDGDTDWGALINFDHPQVLHFFEQNLKHFMENYRVDGFRFDFTRAIRFGDRYTDHVKRPGSGGGFEFLQRLRRAVDRVDAGCLLMAENLPNDWDLTRVGGPLHTQWCDNFHDRLVDAARGWEVMAELSDAMTITHTVCDDWYQSTNYPESHDEVGNEPNRIAALGGIGRGLRASKVAAAATLLSRGIPLWFMGAESAEWRQFSKDGLGSLDLGSYEQDESARRVRAFWYQLCELRKRSDRVHGPAPLRVHCAEGHLLAFSRGEAADLFIVLNFGEGSGYRSLASLNLPDGEYKELLNSTWGEYQIAVESEDEQSNGGWDARLRTSDWLNIPDYGAIVLERR